jgi:osmotically-inducible protein OsmY
MVDRGTDEVRSWFGDDEAEHRRQMDRRWEERRGEGGWRERMPRRDWRDEDRDRYGMFGDTKDDWAAGPAGARGYGRRRDSDGDWGRPGESASRHLSPTAWSYTEVWMIPGPHAGRGPNGYTRSDDRIREDICDRLTQHGLIDASQIDVAVSNGDVTLRGRVPDRESKRRAEDVADSVFGVHDVRNELRTSAIGEVAEARDEANDQNLESPLGIGSSSTAAKKTDRQAERV